MPAGILRLRRRYVADRIDAQFARTAHAGVFERIYAQRMWGRTPGTDYYSGDGSHDTAVVDPYVAAVRRFLGQLPARADAVDLGCGDFNVGARLRDLCAGFVACDVVGGLIEHNTARYCGMNVHFRQLDLVADALPPGELAFLRQVLQHLSNTQIGAIARKLTQYRWVIVSEHLPAAARFPANIDKFTGPGVRERFGSGVVLTEPPFALRPLEQRILCSVPAAPGIVQTVAYRLR